jgi:hypothetical protein
MLRTETYFIWISGNEATVTRVEDAGISRVQRGCQPPHQQRREQARQMRAEASEAAFRVEMEVNVFSVLR